MLLNRLSAFRIAMKVFRIKFKSASLRIAFQSKTHLVAYLNSKIVLLNTFARISYINFRVVNALQLMVKLRDTFLHKPRSISESLHRHRNELKIPKSLPL